MYANIRAVASFMYKIVTCIVMRGRSTACRENGTATLSVNPTLRSSTHFLRVIWYWFTDFVGTWIIGLLFIGKSYDSVRRWTLAFHFVVIFEEMFIKWIRLLAYLEYNNNASVGVCYCSGELLLLMCVERGLSAVTVYERKMTRYVISVDMMR